MQVRPPLEFDVGGGDDLGEAQIEAQIGTGGVGLVHLNRQHVVTVDECIDRHGVFMEILSVVVGILCERVVGDLAVEHVRPDDLGAVQVDDCAVVAP